MINFAFLIKLADELDFATQAVPGMQFGKASAITGNFGAEGLDMIYFVRPVRPASHICRPYTIRWLPMPDFSWPGWHKSLWSIYSRYEHRPVPVYLYYRKKYLSRWSVYNRSGRDTGRVHKSRHKDSSSVLSSRNMWYIFLNRNVHANEVTGTNRRSTTAVSASVPARAVSCGNSTSR